MSENKTEADLPTERYFTVVYKLTDANVAKYLSNRDWITYIYTDSMAELASLKELTAQAPNQPGGFSAGDMASAAAGGYRDGWAAAQADSAEPAATQPAPPADSVLEDAARYRWLRERSSTMFVNISINGEGAEIAATLDSAVDAARKQGEKQ